MTAVAMQPVADTTRLVTGTPGQDRTPGQDKGAAPLAGALPVVGANVQPTDPDALKHASLVAIHPACSVRKTEE